MCPFNGTIPSYFHRLADYVIPAKRCAYYRTLGAPLGDRRRNNSRPEIDKVAHRASPILWAKYVTASAAIEMFSNGNTIISGIGAKKKAYLNERTPGRAIFVSNLEQLIEGSRGFQRGMDCEWWGGYVVGGRVLYHP